MCAREESFLIVETISANSQRVMGPGTNGFKESASIVAVNGANYSTWKIQCRMALIRDGLWDLLLTLRKLRMKKLRSA